MTPTTPTTVPAQRIAILFHRRLSTPWAEKEIKAYKKIKGHFEDLGLIEKYYESERRKGDKGIHRRELYTFLNNYFGEADKARAWAARFNRQPKEIKINPSTGEAMSDEEFQCVGKLVREQLAAFRMSLKP